MRSALRTSLVAAAVAVAARAARADEIIEDPELAEVPHEALVAPPAKNGPKDTIWRLTLHTRWGVDTDWTRPSQDIVEGTTIAAVEAEQRRSDALMLSVGLRARYALGVHQSGSTRYELDVAPTSLFADVTPVAGFHARIGYQTITMGRFDLFSATNFLAVYDLRSGPVTMPEASAIATPALRLDFDHFRGFTLQGYYVPFFQPHLITAYGSDYALFSVYDRAGDANSETVRKALESVFGNRSGLAMASTSVVQALGPPPDLRYPQGAMRATLYGSAGELSVTGGTALEHLPTISATPAFQDLLFNIRFGMMSTPEQIAAALDRPIRVEYGRYEIASLDGALDAGPLQLGAEAAYMWNRTLMATNGTDLQPERVNMAEFALRAELVESAGWAAEVESFFTMAVKEPSNQFRHWYALDDRYLYGVAGGVAWAPEKTHLRFQLGGAAMAIATYVLMPRAEWEAVNTLFFELGAAFVEGRTPGPLGSSNMPFGGFFTDVSQVFLGIRWSP